MARPPRRRALRKTKASRKQTALVKPPTYFFPFILSFFALFVILVAIGGYYLHHKQSLLSFEVDISHLEEKSATNRPTHIKIPSANIDAQIKAVRISKESWPTYEDAISYVLGSGQPTEGGNIVLYSQEKPTLFGRLSQVKVGDVITLTTWDGKRHEYLVQDSMIVGPKEADILLSSHESLTLFTASGFLNSKRLVVRATPIKLPTF